MSTTARYFIEGLHEAGIEYLFANFGTDHVSLIEELARIETEGGPPVGVAADLDYTVGSLELPAGGRIVVATDGVYEQRSLGGEIFGLGRIGDTIAASEGVKDDVSRLVHALRAHADGPFDDDVTVLSVARR